MDKAAVRAAVKAFLSDNESTLVSGLEIEDKITQWSLNQITGSIFTSAVGPIYVVIAIPNARESFDTSKVRGAIRTAANAVAYGVRQCEYDVEIVMAAISVPTEGEEPGGDSGEMHEGILELFDTLVSRTVQLFRDNPTFNSVGDTFSLTVRRDESGRKDQEIRVSDRSKYVKGDGGTGHAWNINHIAIGLETCGEPDP